MSEHRNSVYRSIADDLCKKIHSGEYAIGQKLPPERTLMLEYDVERTTIRRALELLCTDGYIVKRTGLGSFVCSPEKAQTCASHDKKCVVVSEDNSNYRSVKLERCEDILGGADKLVSMLVEYGHDRIAYIGSNAACFGALAAALCGRAMYQPAYFVYEQDTRSITGAFERFWRQLRMPAPTAIVCADTFEALTIERCLERLRLKVPFDVTLAVLYGEKGGRFGGCVYEKDNTRSLFTEPASEAKPLTLLSSATVRLGETIGEKRNVRGKNISDFLL